MIVRNFEYLLALNRERHFGRAAASCHVSQPTLSAGIKQLEEDMDVLIVRRGQRFDGLTPEGERVLAWAQQMMEDCQRLKQELHALREQGVQGQFRLGMSPAAASLAALLAVGFAEQMPALQISIDTADTATLADRVRQGQLDAALTFIDEAAANGLELHALYRERIFLFSSAELGDAARITWPQLVAMPLCQLRAALPQAAEELLAPATKIIYTDSLDVLAAHVASGRWSTILPQSLASRLTRAASLRAIPIAAPGEQANVGFLSARSGAMSRTVQALMEFAHTPSLVEQIRSMLAVHKTYLRRPASAKTLRAT